MFQIPCLEMCPVDCLENITDQFGKYFCFGDNFSSRYGFGKIQVQSNHYCLSEKYAYCTPTFIHG